MQGVAHTAVLYRAAIFASRNGLDPARHEQARGCAPDIAHLQPGFLDTEIARGADVSGMTVSCWRDEPSIERRPDHAGQRPTREPGRAKRYDDFKVRIARVERAHARGADE